MKSIAFWAGICLFTVTSTARAQLVDSLAAASVEYYPSVSNGSTAGSTQINVARASVGAPIPVGKSTKILAGAAYELVDVHPSPGEELRLHSPKLTLGLMHDFSRRWGAVLIGDVGFASDFHYPVGSDDAFVSVTGLVTFAVNDALKLGAGAVYDRRTGKVAPLPAVLVSWRLSERARIRGFAPVWLNAEFRVTDHLNVGVRSTFEGNRFHVSGQELGLRNAELAYSNLTVGPKVTIDFTDWIHLDLYGAGAVYRRYELFQNDDSAARRSLAPVMGYGVRFWLAPSGW